MVYHSMSTSDLTQSANQFKEVFLESMVKEGAISQEKANEMNKYCIVLVKKKFFGKIWDKMWNKDTDTTRVVVVKVIE